MGTPPYMSPEQAQGSASLTVASDVYSLGATLYALLTGRPPFQGDDLLQTLRRVVEDEPAPPRTLNPDVDRDLETICLKCLEKEPRKRYASAEEVADRLQLFLEGKPIPDRPITRAERLWRWCRRNPLLAATGCVAAAGIVAVVALCIVTAWQTIQLARTERDQAIQQARRSEDVHDALTRTAQLREQARSPAGDTGKWEEARAQARRAEGLAKAGPLEPELQEQVAALLGELDQEEKDRKMLAELDDVRLRQAALKGEHFDVRAAVLGYAAAFRGYGIDVEALSVAEAARRVRASQVSEALLTALDHWAYWTEAKDQPGTGKLLAVADAADDNSWRRALLEVGLRGDRARLKALAEDPQGLREPPPVQALLGQFFQRIGLPEEAIVFLRRAQQQHPDDFWLNHDLGYALMEKTHPPQPAQALSYFRAALALRPGSAGVHFNVGNALLTQGDAAGAAVCFHRAIELEPNYAAAHSNLGTALIKQNDTAGATAAYRRATKLNPNNAAYHYNLGIALRSQGDLAGAIASFRRSVELNPGNADALVDLGEALQLEGDLASAAAVFRRAAKLQPEDPTPHYNLGVVLQQRGDPAGAAACCRRVLDLAPNHAEAHCNLGSALVFQGDFRGGLKELQIGHELGSRQKDWRIPSPLWLKHAEQMLELDGRLPAILKGEARPSGAGERIALATLCRYKKLYATSARFFTEAFNDDEKLTDFREAHRCRAACAAALAGCGEGDDMPRPDETERARLRGQALDWLRADLAAWIKHLEGSSPPERAAMRLTLTSWQHDLALASVRDASSLARLPAAERDQWNKLWTDVAATLAKARETK
jgi:serine/threonine-protein kinase